ncbi:MAG: insulinase family protein [Oligoflexia bacterium]|nr:insulinase family protein [Oligoflexia bacterium]
MAARRSKKPRFRKTVFKNGLTLLTERLPEFRSLAIGFWVKAGARHEERREAGVSHFLEHMLFKGTESRSALEIAREVDQVGGDFNAFTAREYTCFHITLLDRDVGLGMEILSDVVLNSNFEAAELERERKVILQEISMVEESPEELVHDVFFEKVYGRHGLGCSILGSETSVRRMSRADMLRFFRRHYRPDQIIISVAGNVTHQAVLKKLGRLTRGSWPGREARKGTRHGLGFVPAPELHQGRWWMVRPTEQVHLVWGVEGPNYSSRDRFAAFLLNVHLGGGMSSSLFQEIREKNGLAYTVYSNLSPHIDSGIFSIYAATGLKQVPLCLRLIEECVEKLKKQLLTPEELEVVKDNLKGTILLSSDSSESRMSSIARNELFLGRYVSPEEVCEQIDAVTPRDIRRVARKLLRDGRRCILALGPKPPRELRKKLGMAMLTR